MREQRGEAISSLITFVCVFFYTTVKVGCCNDVKYDNTVFLPVVFIGKSVEVFLFLMNDVLEALIDGCAAVAYLLQYSLKDNHITNHRIFQYVDLQDKL